MLSAVMATANGIDGFELLRMMYHYRGRVNRMRKSVHQGIERGTRQRDAIRSVIRAAKRPLSPQEVLDAARLAVRGLGMATVYRSLKLFVADGSVQAITLPGEAARYESSETAHHHHFQCTTCRRVYDVHGCPGNLRRLAPRGFSVEHHDVTLYGRCSDCGRRQARDAR
jgi:Fur family ferric uptake transcriptional regulator